jgi:hypothetical protein
VNICAAGRRESSKPYHRHQLVLLFLLLFLLFLLVQLLFCPATLQQALLHVARAALWLIRPLGLLKTKGPKPLWLTHDDGGMTG